LPPSAAHILLPDSSSIANFSHTHTLLPYSSSTATFSHKHSIALQLHLPEFSYCYRARTPTKDGVAEFLQISVKVTAAVLTECNYVFSVGVFSHCQHEGSFMNRIIVIIFPECSKNLHFS
jgi:hypothetical protein